MPKIKKIVKPALKTTKRRGFGKRKKDLKKSEFERYLQKIESPDYLWVAKDLPENATSSEKAKFDICQEFLAFKFRNHLTTQQVAKKIKLDKDETQKLLFCWIDKFSLDELVDYANKLFSPAEVKVTVQPKRLNRTTHARTI